MGHPWRRDGRNLKGWNVACGQAINGELRASFTLPDGALYPNPGEEGKSSEWYYARVQEEDNGEDDSGTGQGTPQSGNGPSTPDPLGEVRDAPTAPDADGYTRSHRARMETECGKRSAVGKGYGEDARRTRKGDQ